MSTKRQGVAIFDLPEGEVVTYNPDQTMRARGNGEVLGNLSDGAWACGGPNAHADGGKFGYVDYEARGGDVTTATPRRTDYGGVGIIIRG